MNRHRLVRETHRDGLVAHDVSGAVLAPDEICELLDFEAALHKAGGWHVQAYGEMVRAEKPGCVRWLYVRARGPMEDTL